MRGTLTISLIGLLVLALASFMFTYTVRFNEVAVKTFFGKAGDEAIVTEPGLKFKLPYPINQVTTYDKRQRVIETRKEAQQTADDRQIIIQSFATYTVTDPLQFFARFSSAGGRAIQHYARAEEVLNSALRSALGEASRYRLDELFAADGQSQIPELEARVLAAMRTGAEGRPLTEEYGIEILEVGISGIEFPQSTTRSVFERMRAERERLAKDIESQGTSRAQTIRSAANANAEKIRAFAENRAAAIRARGEQDAAPYLARMNENPELAVFLSNVELLRNAVGRRVTLVLSTSMPGFGLFSPDAVEGLEPGQVPTSNLEPRSDDEEQRVGLGNGGRR
ncbi:MAG: SPFH domain-containing protein [Planctomycetota bacterium]